jgi:hypothetical protein
VRKLLCEAAWSCVRFNPTLRDFFRRVSGDDPGRRKIAIVATAHRLCRVMAAMLRTGEAWRGQPTATGAIAATAAIAAATGRPSAGGGCSPPEDTETLKAVVFWRAQAEAEAEANEDNL